VGSGVKRAYERGKEWPQGAVGEEGKGIWVKEMAVRGVLWRGE